MSDYNDIFGYKVYKPPPEKNLPVIADLNCYGEVVTLIDPNADVIQDPAVQRIFKSLDGERTVKIEDLPPDIRYDGWNKKAQYDKQVIAKNMGQKANIQPQLPIVNQNLLREDHNSQDYHQEALRQAQIKAMNTKNTELEFARQLQETRLALEKEIHKQLVEQLTLRAQKKSVTPEQQALIEKLYLDLRLINPELALATLKASASLDASPPSPQYSHHNHQQQHSRSRQVQQREEEARHHYHHQHQERVQSSRVSKGPPQLVHNQGSIVNSHDEPPSVQSKSSKSSKSKSSSRR